MKICEPGPLNSPETNPEIQRLISLLGPQALAVWKEVGGSAFNAGDQIDILNKMLRTEAEIAVERAAADAAVAEMLATIGRFVGGVAGLMMIPGNIGQSDDPCQMGELCLPQTCPKPKE